MVHALQALRRKKSLILDTCEIFVKEPLLDWVKDAKQKQPGAKSNEADSVVDSIVSEYEEELQELSWYPRKKIEIVRYKLSGLSPMKILERELKESKHDKRVR
jgi:DNA-dependent protein kinase catalytic subunit